MARDSTYTPFLKSPRPLPKLELLERCWRLRTVAGGQEVVCGIFQTEVGLEVRAGFRTDLLHSKRAKSLEDGRGIAAGFKLTLLEELGGVEELPLEPEGAR